MKKMIILLVAGMLGIASFNQRAEAQSFQVSINIGMQPAWGPVGYDYVDYYYFPDINCYYNVNQRLFYFLDPRGYWVYANYLPYDYRRYDLYRLFKVVINEPMPWRYNHYHQTHFSTYRGRHQIVIRDSRDRRYAESRRNQYNWYSNKNDFRPNRVVESNRNQSRSEDRNRNEWRRENEKVDVRPERRENNLRNREADKNNTKETPDVRSNRSNRNEETRKSVPQPRSNERKEAPKGNSNRSGGRSERSSERSSESRSVLIKR